MKLDELYNIIKDRQKRMPKNSYTSSLFREGSDRIIQKVGEETMEVIIAAKNKQRKQLIPEIADLWFHLLVMQALFNISPCDISNELKQREK